MKEIIALSLLLVGLVVGHEWIHNPFPRTKECAVNGIVMGSRGNENQIEYDAGADSYKQIQDMSQREMLFYVNSMYLDRPCGQSRRSKMDKVVELCGRYATDDYDWDFSIEPRTPMPTFQANTVVELLIKAPDFHPGMVSIRLCYDLPCMRWESYEKYILGYWYNEGVGGLKYPEPADLKVYVKLPNRNCNRCVLQFVTDSIDGRSYVNCADIKIAGATSTGPSPYLSYCNGHPFCDCGAPSYSKSYFGLKGKCPGKASGSGANEVVKSVGEKQFCDWCISNACPFSCGSIWKEWYNTPKKNSNSHTSALDNPNWILCDRNSCNCAGCRPTTRQRAENVTFLPSHSIALENSDSLLIQHHDPLSNDVSGSLKISSNLFIALFTIIAAYFTLF